MEGSAGGLGSILLLGMKPCPVLAKVSCGLVLIMPENLQRHRLHSLYGNPPVLHCSVQNLFLTFSISFPDSSLGPLPVVLLSGTIKKI